MYLFVFCYSDEHTFRIFSSSRYNGSILHFGSLWIFLKATVPWDYSVSILVLKLGLNITETCHEVDETRQTDDTDRFLYDERRIPFVVGLARLHDFGSHRRLDRNCSAKNFYCRLDAAEQFSCSICLNNIQMESPLIECRRPIYWKEYAYRVKLAYISGSIPNSSNAVNNTLIRPISMKSAG